MDDQKNAIERFTANFTPESTRRKTDPVIGRSEEIRRVMHILTRRTKNDPVLLGDPEVG